MIDIEARGPASGRPVRRSQAHKVGLALALLTVTVVSSVVASASARSASSNAAAAKHETDQVACIGASGFSNGTWNFEQNGFLLGQGCKIYSPDNFSVSGVQPPPAPGTPVITKPQLCKLINLLCNVFTVANTICSIEQADCFWLTGTAFSLISPVFSTFSDLSLTGSGSFSCGNGTLTGTGTSFNGPEPNFSLVWTATIKNGVGTITGTATSQGNPADDPSDFAGAVKKLTGHIIIADGDTVNVGPFGFGPCNDRAGQNPTVVQLTFSG